MGRKSTIKMLPRAVQAEISNLHRAGYTNQQITQHLRELGGNTVSKSAVQRWAKDLNRVGKRLNETRQVAEGLVANLGEDGEGKLPRLNIEMLHEVLLRMLVGKEGKPVEFDPKEAMMLANMLQNLARASKADAETHARIRQTVLTEAAAQIKYQGANKGLSPEAITTVETLLKGI